MLRLLLRLAFTLASAASAVFNPCGREPAWPATRNATASLDPTLFAPSARGAAPSAAARRLGLWRAPSTGTACWAARLRGELAARGAAVRRDLARHFHASTAPGVPRRAATPTIYDVLAAYLPRVGVNGVFEAWCELKRSIARAEGCGSAAAPCASESTHRENHLFAAYVGYAVSRELGPPALGLALDAAERVAAERRDDANCSFVFRSGAFHVHGVAWGGMIAAARVADGDARATARFVEGACAFLDETTNAYHACVHGIGHGALHVFRPRDDRRGEWRGFFDGPLAVCAALAGGAWFKLKCATGVFHEAAVDATAPGFGARGDGLLETFAPCHGLPAVVAGAASTCLWAKLRSRAKQPEDQALFANERDGARAPCLACAASGPCDRGFAPACAYAEAAVAAAARHKAGVAHARAPAEVCAAWDATAPATRRAYLACVGGAHNAEPDARVAPFTKGRGADEEALAFDARLDAFRARPPRIGRPTARPSCAGLDDEASRVCAAAAAAAGSLEEPELFDIVAAFESDARRAY